MLFSIAPVNTFNAHFDRNNGRGDFLRPKSVAVYYIDVPANAGFRYSAAGRVIQATPPHIYECTAALDCPPVGKLAQMLASVTVIHSKLAFQREKTDRDGNCGRSETISSRDWG